ncbi:type II secretion system F family protein [Secundilactobacillus odoratitofui]|uniref:type II secretion system F family protein n=2 Tax=Secundilactobacillus odoratitofui TaxID=480930 RepID=UPI000705539A|nr:type II secretion system F family protein [Secundilactobacillus odoratitofui]
MPNALTKLVSKPMTSSKRVKAWPVKVQAEVFQVISDLLVVGFSVRHAIEFCELIFIKQQAHLRQINQDLRAGQSVSEAFGTVIDEQIRFQLKLAEEHGQLASSLGQISRLLQTAHQRQQKIKRLLQYPLVLVVILAMVIMAMKILIMPQLTALAPPTRNSQLSWWWLVVALPFAAAIGLIILYVAQQPILRRVLIIIKIPLIGPIVKLYYGYYFLMALTVMSEGGLGFQEILVVLRQGKSTTLLHQIAERLANDLANGEWLANAIKRFGFLPIELQLILKSGKSQTTIAEELTALTALYYQRLTQRLERLLSMIQPASFAIIGMIIIGAYASLFLPMYRTIGGM